MTTAIASVLLEEIQALAAADTHEICGLLFGEPGIITGIAPANNVAPDPARHFELDPAVLLAAHRASRAGGPRLVGHYHSHPSGICRPSATDVSCAAPDGSLWLIVTGREARLWRAVPNEQASDEGGRGAVRFVEEMLDIR